VEQQNQIYCKSRATKFGKRNQSKFPINLQFQNDLLIWDSFKDDFRSFKMWEENRKWSNKLATN